jgi:hypothetical protein
MARRFQRALFFAYTPTKMRCVATVLSLLMISGRASPQTGDGLTAQKTVQFIVADVVAHGRYIWTQDRDREPELILLVRNWVYVCSPHEAQVRRRVMTKTELGTCPRTPPIIESLREVRRLKCDPAALGPELKWWDVTVELASRKSKALKSVNECITLSELLIKGVELVACDQTESQAFLMESFLNTRLFVRYMNDAMPKLAKDFADFEDVINRSEAEDAAIAGQRAIGTSAEEKRLAERSNQQSRAILNGSPSCLRDPLP